MRTLFTALLASIVLVIPVHAQEQLQQQQPGDAYRSQTIVPDAFDTVSLSGALRVSVRVSDGPPRVVLTGPPAMLADVVAEVDDGTLSIHFREGASWSWNPGSGVDVLISTPTLVAARSAGPGGIDVAGVRGDAFSAATSGAGSIVLRDLDVGEALFATAGSGGIVAEGIAREGIYATAGSGSIDARRLKVENAQIDVGGAGSIFADVSQAAIVSVAGSGSADVVGGATCDGQDTGSGTIECR